MFELCENTTRPSPRQRSHPRLDSYEVLHSDGAQAGGQTSRLNLHDAARPERRRQIAQPNTGRPCASPSPSLRSTSASAWAAQPRRLPVAAVCANVNTPPYAARLPLPLEALMDFPQCRNLGPCHQCKFTPKKLSAPHTHTAPWRRPRRNILKYYARSPQHAANSPLRCRIVDMPRKRRRNKPNTIDRT